MSRRNKIIIMSKNIVLRHKRHYGFVPKCVSCGAVILVGTEAETMKGASRTKYLCERCLKLDVVVYQYPKPLKPANATFKGLKENNRRFILSRQESLKEELKVI